MADAWPRQPRADDGCGDNAARVIQLGGVRRTFGVECWECPGSWVEVARFRSEHAATTMRRNLEWVFSHPGADLDFITMTAFPGGEYAVVWPGQTWDRTHQVKTRLGDCTPGHVYVTYEKLYQANRVFTIKRVQRADIDRYRKPAYEIAFEWTNNIRNAVNGWNCTKDATGGYGLVNQGKSYPFKPAVPWDFDTRREDASYYGFGECQPNFEVANTGEIFHCMDLGIAVPGPRHTRPMWALNQWVKVKYRPAGSTVHARLNAVSGTDKVDLSRGTATALRFPGGGHVEISRP